MIDELKQDIRYGARQLIRAPLFTVVSAISIGIGIAVAVTVFSIVNSILFKPLPVDDPQHLLYVVASDNQRDRMTGFAYDDVADLRGTGVFDRLAAVSEGWVLKLTANGHAPENVRAGFVSPDFMDVAGIRLLQGRAFSATGTEPEIIISERYRDRVFKPGEQVLGATIRVKDATFTVIGVLPRKFRGFGIESAVMVWVPAQMRSVIAPGSEVNILGGDRTIRVWSLVGRLRSGTTRAVAEARLNANAHQLAERYPLGWRDEQRKPLLVRIQTPSERTMESLGPDLSLMLGTLGALVAIVLVLACTNVAGLLLARAVSRRHEVAVRLTLGASRRRLLTQLLTESVMLAFIGGVVGIFIAECAILAAGKTALLDYFDLTPDWRVFAAAGTASFISAVIFGITPSTQALRVDLKSGLSAQGMLGERGGVRARLMALQVCLAFLLIVLGASASRSVRSQLQASNALDARGMLVVDLGFTGRDTAAWRGYVTTLIEEMRRVDDVAHVVASTRVPLEAAFAWDIAIPTASGPIRSGYESVDPDYFATVGVQLVNGRIPRPGDHIGPERVAVVSRSTVLSAGHDLLGGTITIGGEQVRVVGVVEDVRHHAVETERTSYVYELRNGPPMTMGRNYLLARVKPGSEAAVIAAFTKNLRARLPNQILPEIATLKSRLQSRLAPERFIERVALGIAAVELALAAIGLYSLLLYATLSRTREIGLRMALGARPVRASLTVMSDGWLFVLAGASLGVVLGVPAAFLAARNITGVRATDPAPFVAAIGGILVATIAASIVPARKAAGVEPMEALRYE